MHQEATLIATVAMGFVFAFACGFVADRLRLPPLVGYLVAGICVGPFTPGYVADGSLAGELAEMGVILLMFGVGLHFSAADLFAVRWLALPGAVGQIVLATLLGLGISTLWGWSLGAGLLFGLSLSVASTVVLLRALEQRSLLGSPNGRVAVGWLIVEDLAMVLALVLIPALAPTLGGTAGEHASDGNLLLTLAITLGKVAIFVALAVALGPKVVPWLLLQVARTGSRELFTLAVLALALGIAFGSAVIFGVSFALGAFFAGVVLSESRFSHKAAQDSLPLQDAFAVLFFVSVGMLFDPSILVREPLAVLAVVALIVVGKSIIAFLIVIALGYPFATGLMVSASLSQIGEFSFILAGLGLSLDLLPPEGRDLIVAGALISILLNPLAFALVERIVSGLGPKVIGYGRARYQSLEHELAVARQRMLQQEHEHGLRIAALVETFPMFAALSEEDQEELLLLFRPRSVTPGTKIIRAGDRGDAMFFVSQGNVEVKLPGGPVSLGPGDIFGEMALLTGARRSADVVAVDFCRLYVLPRRDFFQFVAKHPQLRASFKALADTRGEANRSGAGASLAGGS